ncbi:hypothetical protein HN011_006490 [Eciton burchellii]|nr:hypothetical protein HN011_006490 [Eciton burchellii]
MVFIGKRCLKLHRLLFMLLGLWPYQKTCILRLQAVFFFSVYCGFLIFQLTAFLTSTCNMNCILKRFSYICITLVYILNYYSFYFNSEIIKQTLEHMQLDWKIFKDADSIKIFEEYLSEAYIFVFSSCIFLIMIIFVFVIFESASTILDIIVPMNESRSRNIEIDLEFFIDKEQYFFLYVIHEIGGLSIGILSIITTGTYLATLGKHLCAIYKIASYLIQNIVTIRTLQLPTSQRMQFMYRRICLSVHIHRRNQEISKRFFISFNLWYFPLLLLGVLSLSCILFRLSNAIRQFDMYNILLSSLILYGYLIYMFVGNFLVGSYTEHSDKILDATYDTLWYVAPLPIQKLFLIIQKSVQRHKIILGGLFVPSIEGFSTLVTSAVSYFTVMHAMSL